MPLVSNQIVIERTKQWRSITFVIFMLQF